MESINLEHLLKISRRQRGKALFLDTMGFANPDIMGGHKPLHDAVESVERNFRGSLRDRHRVLAWLAREGLCPIVLTTNYDLLIEGGYRLAGFEPRPSP